MEDEADDMVRDKPCDGAPPLWRLVREADDLDRASSLADTGITTPAEASPRRENLGVVAYGEKVYQDSSLCPVFPGGWTWLLDRREAGAFIFPLPLSAAENRTSSVDEVEDDKLGDEGWKLVRCLRIGLGLFSEPASGSMSMLDARVPAPLGTERSDEEYRTWRLGESPSSSVNALSSLRGRAGPGAVEGRLVCFCHGAGGASVGEVA